MTKLVANHEVRVVRDGKNQTVKAGTAFAFTKTEQEDILKARPDSLRAPNDESGNNAAALKERDAAVDAQIVELNQRAEAAERDAAESAEREKNAQAELKRLQGIVDASTAQANSKPAPTAKGGVKTAQGNDDL